MIWFYIVYSGFYKAHFVVLKAKQREKKIVLAQKKLSFILSRREKNFTNMIFCVYARIKISSNELYGVLIQSGSFICICASLIFKIKLDKKPFLKLNTWPNIGLSFISISFTLI